MVSKKILGVAIAAAFSTQAFAAFDLTEGTSGAGTGAVVYAKESITTGQVTSGFVQVAGASPQLNVIVAAGFGVTSTTHAFLRFDLTNAKFKTAVVAGDLVPSTVLLGGQVASAAVLTNVTVAQGGAAGDSYVIFDVTSGGIAQADELALKLVDLQVSPTSPVSINYAHYSTSPAAVAGSATVTTGALATDSYAAITVANALTPTITPNNLIADVGTGAATPFTTFVTPASAGPANLGKVNFKLTAGTLTAAGATVTALNQLIDVTDGKSSLSVTGDLGFTTSTSAALTAADLTFGAQVSNTAATNVPSGKTDKFTTAAFAVDTDYNIAVTGKSAINAGDYSLTFTPTAIASAQYGAASVTGALGSISRNGATAQVPYLTTNTGLNQKLVLVNRGATSTTYSISFTPEAGVTATAGTAATGTLAAKETKVLKAADVVTLTGGTRTAATFVALSPAGNIDAATQTVVTDPASVSFGSNDTVNLTVK